MKKACLVIECLCILLFLTPDAIFPEETEPTVEWVYEGRGQFYVHPILADLAVEPGLEIVVTSGDDRTVKSLSAKGDLLWSFNQFDKRLTATPAVGDVDQDKEVEILVGGGDGSLTCLGGDGKVEWKQRLEGRIVWSGVTVADLAGDGAMNVITGTDQGKVLVYDGKGRLIWNRKLDSGVSKPIAVADLDGKKGLELIVPCGFRWYCLSHDGQVMWRRLGGEAASNPVVVDLDGDRRPEILLLTTDGQLLCLEGMTGAPRWSYRTVGGNITSGCGIALGDLNGDSSIEIVFADDAGFLYFLNARGEEIRAIHLKHRASGSATVGDVDGDGKPEILLAGMDGVLRCFSASGVQKWEYVTQRRLMAPPTLGDPDQDGVVEIVLATGDGDIVCLSCGGATQPEGLLWPSRLYDAAQTGWMR